jgi:Transglycosylase SLT domain/Tetratricopeptide repeat
MFLRYSQIAATLLISSVLLQSCGSKLSFENSAHSKTRPLTAILADENSSTAQQSAALREFLSAEGVSEQQKSEASYVLARIQQQTVAFDSKSQDPKTNGSDQLTDTIRLFDEASQLPSLAERSAVHIAEIATTIGDEERARAALEFLKRKATGVERARYQYQIGQSEMRTQELDKAQALFIDLKKQHPDTEYAKACNYYLAQIELAGAQNSADESRSSPDGSHSPSDGARISLEAAQRAVSLLRQYIHSAPDGRFANDAIAKLNDLVKNGSAQLSAADHDAFGLVYFSSGRYADALSEWSQAKPGVHAIKQAICYARTNKSALAQRTLIQAIGAHPDVSYEATAALISGPLSRADTKTFWHDILMAHPARDDDPLWNIAIRSNPPEAIPLYKRILTKYPTSEYSPECVWWIFWDLAKQYKSDPVKAAAALQWAKEGLTKYPTSKAAARLGFWSGKLHEQLKQPEEARLAYQFSATHFPSYYYGHRAKARLKKLSAAAPKPVADPVADPATDPGWSTKPARVPPSLKWHWPSPQEVISFEHMGKRYGATLTELVKLHQYDEAVGLLPEGSGPEFKASLLAAGKKPLQAINAANRELNGNPKLDDRWEMAYPLEYADWISSEAKSNGVDPLLVHALIREESRYNPDALSRVKALGLMQLMPGTAYGVAKRLSVPLSGTQEVLKPEVNIKLGTNYLAYTLRRFDGNALLAIASYNGGPNAVQSWFQQHKLAGNSDFDIFVENIPFRETRDYVRKVFGSYWTYEQLYGGKNI